MWGRLAACHGSKHPWQAISPLPTGSALVIHEMPPNPEPVQPPSLFQSFWMAGYESSCHFNPAGRRVDMIAVTQHDIQVRQDYNLLRSFGITTARDAVRWPLVDRAGCYDFSSFAP